MPDVLENKNAQKTTRPFNKSVVLPLPKRFPAKNWREREREREAAAGPLGKGSGARGQGGVLYAPYKRDFERFLKKLLRAIFQIFCRIQFPEPQNYCISYYLGHSALQETPVVPPP